MFQSSRRLRSSLVSSFCFLMSVSCSVALVEDTSEFTAINQCSVDVDCLDGLCVDGLCQSAQSEFSAVLLEVVPNLGVPEVGGLRFFIEVESLKQEVQLELPSISQFSGTVKGANLVPESCVSNENEDASEAAPDGTLPVRVSLLPRQGILGLSVAPFTTEIAPGDDDSYEFEIQVPPGEYDMYLEPLANDGQCVRPPYLALNQELNSGEVRADLELPTPERLTMKIEREAGAASLDGWQVSIVEQGSARRLSNIVELGEPKRSQSLLEYQADLTFSPVQGDDLAPATELVRLLPPAGVIAPTIFFQRSVVEIFEDNFGVINGLGELDEAVSFRGGIRAAEGVVEPLSPTLDSDMAQSAQAPLASALSSLTFVADELATVPDGVTVEFSQVVETNEKGDFEVQLLPGRYSVLIQPMTEALAQVEVEVEVDIDGNIDNRLRVELPKRSDLMGEVLSPSGEAVNGASVLTVALPTSLEDEDNSLASPILGGPSVVVTRNSQAQTDESGAFELFADNGSVDLVARSATGSGYPWAVDVGYVVSEETLEVGSIRLSEPYLVDGVLSLANADVVNGALIRTYAYANQSGIVEEAESGTRLVQIGESRVDESGDFQLYLPSSFD